MENEVQPKPKTKRATGRRGHGEGSIYQRESDGRWVAVYDAGRGPLGKRIRKTAYASTRKGAADRLPDLKKEALRQKTFGAARTHTIAPFLHDWLETKIKIERAPKTYESYESVVRLHISPAIGTKRLDRLSRTDIQTMLNTMSNKKGIGPRSVENARAIIRNALNDAIEWGLIDSNPAEHTSIKPVPRTDRNFLSLSQAQQLFKTVANDRFEALYILAAVYGLRRGECLGLRWTDIDEADQTIRIRQQVIVID